MKVLFSNPEPKQGAEPSQAGLLRGKAPKFPSAPEHSKTKSDLFSRLVEKQQIKPKSSKSMERRLGPTDTQNPQTHPSARSRGPKRSKGASVKPHRDYHIKHHTPEKTSNHHDKVGKHAIDPANSDHHHEQEASELNLPSQDETSSHLPNPENQVVSKTDHLSQDQSTNPMMPPQDEILLAQRDSILKGTKVSTESLKSVGKAFQQTMPLQKTVPAVSFVTGQLQFIHPKEITDLISTNQFITKSLEQDDLSTLMDQPKSLEEIFNALDMGQSHRSIAQNLGLNIQDITTPTEFFKSMGIDPAQVKTEITLLKANLPIDGLETYIARSQSFYSPEHSEESDLTITNMGAEDNGLVLPNIAQDISLNPSHRLDSMNENPQKISLQDSDKKALPGMTPLTDIVMNEAGLPNDTGMTRGIKNQITPELAARQLNRKEFISAKVATEDPYEALGEDLGADVVKLTPKHPKGEVTHDFVMPKSVPTYATSTTASTTTPLENSVGLDKTPEKIQNALIKPLENPKDLSPHIVTDQSEKIPEWQNIIQSNQEPVQAESTKTISREQIGQATMAQQLAELINEERNTVTHIDTSTQSHDHDHRPFSGNQEIDLALMARSEPNLIKDPFPLSSLHKIQEAPQINRYEAIEKIINRASLMVQEGGGSARLQLESENLGNLDIAVNVAEQGVKLRIMASNDQVRDVLITEIPKMREMLEAQNMRLDNIEVGTSDRSTYKGEYSDHGHQNQQNFEQHHPRQSQNEFLPFSKNVRQIPRQWERPRNMATRTTHSGQIQVFA